MKRSRRTERIRSQRVLRFRRLFLTLLVRPTEFPSSRGYRSFPFTQEHIRMRKHRYVRWAYENMWEGPPLSFKTRSSIPSASGLGSSAALSCSIAAILNYLSGPSSEESTARSAFDIEYNVQGRASPTDTSCSTHGNGILVSYEEREDLLWSIGKEDTIWHIHHIVPPEIDLVVGYTRKPSITPIMPRP